MEKEIKKILKALDNSDKDLQDVKKNSLILTMKEQKILLDYITNLQEEIEVYKNLVEKKWEGN